MVDQQVLDLLGPDAYTGNDQPAPAPSDPNVTTVPKNTGDPEVMRLLGDEAYTPYVAPGSVDTGSASRAFAGGIVQGIPFLGAPIYGFMERAVAAMRAGKVPGLPARGSTSYEEQLKELQAKDIAEAGAHPIAKAAGEITGGVAATLPLGMTAAGAKLLGMEGPMASRVIAGAGSGAVWGAGDATVRKLLRKDADGNPVPLSLQDIKDIGKAGALGTVFGAAAGPIGSAIGWGLSPILRWAGGVPGKVDRLLAESGKSGSDVAADLAHNPRLAPVDVLPSALVRAQGIAAQPGEGKAIIDAFVAKRRATMGDAVTGEYDKAMGPVPDVKQLLDDIRSTARTNADKGFREALKDAKPVDMSPVADFIDKKLGQRMAPGTAFGPVEQELSRWVMRDLVEVPNQAGIKKAIAKEATLPDGSVDQAKVAEILNRPEFSPVAITDVNRLHEIQQALRKDAEGLIKAGGQDARVGYALKDLRAVINKQIDKATGGKFKPAQKQFADDMSVQDAFAKGLEVFNNRKGMAGLEDRPEYWKAWLDDASMAEKDALEKGVRVAADQALRSVRFASRKGATIPEVGFNADKLRLIIGEKDANKFINALQDELRMAKTDQDLTGGSMTAIREAAKKDVGYVADIGREKPTLYSAVTALPRKVVSKMQAEHAAASNAELAGVLTSPGRFAVTAAKGAARTRHENSLISRTSRAGNALTRGAGTPLMLWVGSPAEGYK